MITIDEAISKQRKIAESQRLLYEVCILKEQNTHFLRRAEEHEQLAEWLEELKTYRECNVCEYNKALDDFVEKLIRYVDCGHLCSPTEVTWSDLSVVEMVKKLAEQLKAGVED